MVQFRQIRPLGSLSEALTLLPFLGLCAFAGVLTRIGLAELFGPPVLAATSNRTETFPDWFANAWGTFVMGFLSLQRVTPRFANGRKFDKHTVLRRSWLYVGLASGYCGSTTTFSSWNQDAAVLVVTTADVVTYLVILIDGVAVPLFFFIVGQHCYLFLALLYGRYRHKRKRTVTEGEEVREKQKEAAEEEAIEARQAAEVAVTAGEITKEESGIGPETPAAVEVEEEEEKEEAKRDEKGKQREEAAEEETVKREQALEVALTAGEITKEEARIAPESAAEEVKRDEKGKQREEAAEVGATAGGAAKEGIGPASAPTAAAEEKERFWRASAMDLVHFGCAAPCFLALALLWLLLAIYDVPDNRYIWISCLFAPFGVYIRYFLSKYNAWTRCARFPFFTFLVNVVGSIALAFVAISINLRGYNVNTDAPGYILSGFQVGFLGSLTTVSTFIAEIHTLDHVPFAYIYGLSSIATTQTALILINGLYFWLK